MTVRRDEPAKLDVELPRGELSPWRLWCQCGADAAGRGGGTCFNPQCGGLIPIVAREARDHDPYEGTR